MHKKIGNKTIILFILWLMVLKSAYTQAPSEKLDVGIDKKEVYSGGMLILQSGFIAYDNNHTKIRSYSSGLGGILRLYINEYICIGLYGGTQKTNYDNGNSNNSYLHIGYGGPFIGMNLRKGKTRYTLAACIGGGSIKNLHIENQRNNTLLESYLYKKQIFIISPLLSMDYFISSKIALSLQATCLFGVNAKHKTLYNPCLQVGILFNR